MAEEEVDWGMDDTGGYDDDCLSIGDDGEFADGKWFHRRDGS